MDKRRIGPLPADGEDFYRLKKVQAKNKAEAEAAEEQEQAKKAQRKPLINHPMKQPESIIDY